MPRELNEENLKEAYCKVIACTGIGAAEDNCDEVFPKLVKVVVPQPMHDDYSAKLLACAIKICTNEPYGWRVTEREPDIKDNTSFADLYESWFREIVWPA
jgi:hypothetical protein